ncbi:MAG: hypothetical protein JSW26_03255 [Desulfobacterales bacterium]|nr:MAG: hypothetical protein JSW26_03255 [Desulfobacterales bacterium]
MTSECEMRNSGKRWSLFRIPCAVRRAPIILLFFVLAPWVLWAAGPVDHDSGTLSASLDRESVKVGGVVWLTLDYRLPEGGRLPEKPAVKGLDGLTILKQSLTSRQIRIQLLVDQVDSWQSAPLRLEYLDSEGRTQVLTTDTVALQVDSNLGQKPEEAQLRPIQDIIAVHSIWHSYLLWTTLLAAVVLTGLGLLWRHKKRRKSAVSLEAVEPPHVRARRAIEQLEMQEYFEKGMVKTHYFVFSEIIRRYLAAIRNFPAAEYTTEEIAQHIRIEQDRRLLPLLQQADLVKFADVVPTAARKEEDIKAALAYIQETSPVMETVPADGRRPEVPS